MKPSASADRVVRVLTFLGSHDEAEYPLSELARRVGIDKGTCHAILLSLTERGFVIRNERSKTYALGPAVSALANAEGAHQRMIRTARSEMERLSGESELEAVATVASGDQILVVARVLPSPLFGLSLRVGQSVPLVPPLGTVHLAWASDERIDAWIRRAGHDVQQADLDRYRQAIAAVRGRGYSVTLDETARQRLREALERISESPADRDLLERRDQVLDDLGHDEYQLLELHASETYRVNQISAPVFNGDGRVAMAIGVMTQAELPAATVPHVASAVTTAAARVTRSIDGRVPAR